MMAGAMFIPTQQERYSKVARITLLLCVILPSAIVAWLAEAGDLLSCLCGFLWPIALPLTWLGFTKMAAVCLSAFFQAVAFVWLTRSRRLTPRGKLTLAVTWGMFFALLLRVLIAFELWRSITGR